MASKARPGAGALEGLALGLLLWRVQLQMFINQTVRSRNAGRIAGTIAGAAVILLAWSWEGFITWLGAQASHRVPVRIDTVHLLSLAFLAYTGVLVFSSLIFSLNALLLNPDLDLLLAAPRSVESVLASRMVVQLLRLFLLSLLFTAPALLLLGFANQSPLIPLAFAMLFGRFARLRRKPGSAGPALRRYRLTSLENLRSRFAVSQPRAFALFRSSVDRTCVYGIYGRRKSATPLFRPCRNLSR